MSDDNTGIALTGERNIVNLLFVSHEKEKSNVQGQR